MAQILPKISSHVTCLTRFMLHPPRTKRGCGDFRN
jgi:hypothetical protein